MDSPLGVSEAKKKKHRRHCICNILSSYFYHLQAQDDDVDRYSNFSEAEEAPIDENDDGPVDPEEEEDGEDLFGDDLMG